MSKVHIVVSRTTARAETGATLPLPDAIPALAATVNTGAASAVAAIMPPLSGLQCHVTAIGGSVWLAFGTGSDPTADEGKGWLLLEGETRSFGVEGAMRLAAKDAVL
ncbi:hypothetical protein [uncultured Sphingomonas sp.]|uniref:hypothetical protein n=1 Tax=uncultured Sphingomonas sp. TaxID=158754 RepID=UPI0025D64EC4|nr:hypothetical protein [uncultured Sphingomonas sp.]